MHAWEIADVVLIADIETDGEYEYDSSEDSVLSDIADVDQPQIIDLTGVPRIPISYLLQRWLPQDIRIDRVHIPGVENQW